MQIWTTPQLNEFLVIKELPVKLLPDCEIRREFLLHAEPGDIAIIGLDDDYLNFLTAAKDRCASSPIILISPEPIMYEADLHRYNALVLDMKKMGSSAVNNIVHYFLFMARHYRLSSVPCIPHEVPPPSKAEEKPIEDAPSIREWLAYAHKQDLSVIVALDVHENDEPVTARGACAIKAIEDDVIVFHRFKQSLLFRGMKQGTAITLFRAYKQKNYGAVVTIQNKTDKEVYASAPKTLFITRDMRIQPNRKTPVRLYTLIANEPTTYFRVIDISPRGIGFLCSRDLPIDSVLYLTILLPDPQAIVIARGIIRFKKESQQEFRYGAEIRPHPWDEESIAKYVMKREAEIIDLLRNSC